MNCIHCGGLTSNIALIVGHKVPCHRKCAKVYRAEKKSFKAFCDNQVEVEQHGTCN